MTHIFYAITLGLTVSLSAAVAPEQQSTHAEALKLLHYTKQVRYFRDDVSNIINGAKEQNPKISQRYWDDVAREVSVDAYAQWIVGLFERDLTDAELQQLNAVFSDSTKSKLLEELLVTLNGKTGEDLVRSVQEFKKSRDPQAADEIVTFMQSQAARSYSNVLGEIKSGQDELTMRLVKEADARVRARSRQRG